MLNQLYVSVVNNLFFGGAAAMIVIAFMFWRARKVAASGNTSKMVTYSVAPAAMVIASIIITGVAITVALPRLQALITSTPVQNALEIGNTATAQLDALLSSDGLSSATGGLQVPTQAPAQEVFDAVSSSNEVAVESAPVVAPLEMKPLDEMFEAAQVNLVSEQPANAPTGNYIVQSGDTLFKIAQRIYGDGNKYVELCRANGLGDCSALKVGMSLTIPADSVDKAYAPTTERNQRLITQAPVRIAKPSTANVAVQNTSYIPAGWSVLEQGEMSVGEPANMSVAADSAEVFASFPTK